MPTPPDLPRSVHVIERGWLNCNQIVLLGRDDNVLIDSGYGRDARITLDLLRQVLVGKPLHRLINTHCHSDHMGANALLQRTYQCRVTIPVGEVRHVSPWTEQSCWAEMTGQYAECFTFDDTLQPGDRFTAGGYEWNALAAPGHDMAALMYFCEEAGILVTGDALWENGLGFVWPVAFQGSGEPQVERHLGAALSTLDTIETLNPKVVIPGHGTPFAGVPQAISRARGRLQAFAKDPQKNIRHVTKVMFVFALLDKGRMAVKDIPYYLASVPLYGAVTGCRQLQEFTDLAERLLAELLTAEVIAQCGDWIAPRIAA